MIPKTYSVKLKDGQTLMEIAGDKQFVTRALNLLKPVLKGGLRSSKTPRTTLQIKKKSKKTTIPESVNIETDTESKPVPELEPVVLPVTVPEPPAPDLDKLTLSELFKVKVPKRDNHMVLMMAFYANKVLQKKEFKGVDLEKLYAELNMTAPKNLSNFLRRMAENKDGLVVHGSKHGRYKITREGIAFIHEKIPSE